MFPKRTKSVQSLSKNFNREERTEINFLFSLIFVQHSSALPNYSRIIFLSFFVHASCKTNTKTASNLYLIGLVCLDHAFCALVFGTDYKKQWTTQSSVRDACSCHVTAGNIKFYYARSVVNAVNLTSTKKAWPSKKWPNIQNNPNGVMQAALKKIWLEHPLSEKQTAIEWHDLEMCLPVKCWNASLFT